MRGVVAGHSATDESAMPRGPGALITNSAPRVAIRMRANLSTNLTRSAPGPPPSAGRSFRLAPSRYSCSAEWDPNGGAWEANCSRPVGPFARTAADIDSVFAEIAGWSIVDELSKPERNRAFTGPSIAQPANFLLQVELIAELAGLGVEPAAIVGHSVGEVTAAYVSGAVDACAMRCW